MEQPGVGAHTAEDEEQPDECEVVHRRAREDPLAHALALDRADPGEPVRESPLLLAQAAEGLPLVVVVGVETRVEDEAEARGNRLRREHAVLAAVALVPAQRCVPRDGHAVRGDEAHVARLAEWEVRGLGLEVRDPAPRRLRRERSRAAHDRAGELLERAREPGRPARRRHGVGVEEDDDVAGRGFPAAVARPAGEERPLVTDDAGSGSSATAAVRSVDASSTTITSSGAGRCSASEPATEPSIRSALCAGITTLMLGDTVG